MPHNLRIKPSSSGQRRRIKAGAVRAGTQTQTDKTKLGVPPKTPNINQRLASIRGKLSD